MCQFYFTSVFVFWWTEPLMWFVGGAQGNDVWVASLGQYTSEYLQQL